MQLDTSNSVCRLIEANPSLAQKVIPEKGRGQGHVTNFYILYLKVSPQEVIGVLVQSTNLSTVSLWITSTRGHGWIHKFIICVGRL